jgi:hypothetical protein
MSGLDTAGIVTAISASLAVTGAAVKNFITGWKERILKEAAEEDELHKLEERIKKLEDKANG